MNLDRVLRSLFSSPASAGLAGVVAGGLLTSKGGRKIGRKALELGGMAALAGLAYTAWRRHQAAPGGEHSAPAPTAAQLQDSGFLPPPSRQGDQNELGTALFRAMVAAARADGRLDVAERRALYEQLSKLDLPEAERAELYAEIESPASLEQVVACATTRERAIEIYLASRLAIQPDSAAERGYLALLAARLGLDDALVQSLEASASESGEDRSSKAVAPRA